MAKLLEKYSCLKDAPEGSDVLCPATTTLFDEVSLGSQLSANDVTSAELDNADFDKVKIPLLLFCVKVEELKPPGYEWLALGIFARMGRDPWAR